MLRTALAHHGLTSLASVHVADLCTGRQDFTAFLAEHDPRVLVCDITIPYDRNWAFPPVAPGAAADARPPRHPDHDQQGRAGAFVGPTQAIEIHGKPYDVEQIVEAVKKALEAA